MWSPASAIRSFPGKDLASRIQGLQSAFRQLRTEAPETQAKARLRGRAGERTILDCCFCSFPTSRIPLEEVVEGKGAALGTAAVPGEPGKREKKGKE